MKVVFYYIYICMNMIYCNWVYYEFNNNIYVYVCIYFIIYIFIDILRDLIKLYCDKDVGKFVIIVVFDCRGIELVDFFLRVSLSV